MSRSIAVSLTSAAVLAALVVAVGAPTADAQGILSMVEANRPTTETGEIGDPNKCLAGKLACARVLAASMQKCAMLCAKKPDKKCYESHRACVEKVKDKFMGGNDPETGCFAKLEAKQDRAIAQAVEAGQTALSEKQASAVCLTRGDAKRVLEEIDLFVRRSQQMFEPNHVPGVVGIRGFSFFLGDPGQSCDAVCASKGLPFDVAGTDAFAAFSQDGCRSVLEAVPGSPCAGLEVHQVFEDAPGCGCGFFDEPSPSGEPFHCIRDVAEEANATCSVPGLSRACACANVAPDESRCPEDCVRRMANVLHDTTGWPFPVTGAPVCTTTQTTISIYHGVAIPPHYDWIDIRAGDAPDSWVCRIAAGGFDPIIQIALTKTQREDCSRIAASMIDALLVPGPFFGSSQPCGRFY